MVSVVSLQSLLNHFIVLTMFVDNICDQLHPLSTIYRY